MITLTTEQAQQIEKIVEHLLVEHPTARHHKACVEALSIIRAARAQEQAEQEPVGVYYGKVEGVVHRLRLDVGLPIGTPLYAAPVRTKDLTDAEVEWLVVDMLETWTSKDTMKDFARAVIAADREKNK